MKNILAVFLLVILIASNSQGQNFYSDQNLKQATAEDLNLYLTKAKKLKKAGGTVLIVAPFTAALGAFLWVNAWGGGQNSEAQLKIGSGLIVASLAAPVIGIPLRIVGSSRVKKVSNVLNPKNNVAWIELAPVTLVNYQERNVYPGIGISMRWK